MPANFNRIAPIYDQLSFLVFGKNLIEAKKAFTYLIPENSRVLLMGGGTGNILNAILEKNSSVIIDFVEPSDKMIFIAKKNLSTSFHSRVNFICGDEKAISGGTLYDVSTSFFVMDCFTQQHTLAFAKKITSQLKTDGLWLFADFFDTGRWHHRALISFMYRFFKIAANIESTVLPDYEEVFQQCGFKIKAEKQLMRGLVKSLALQKS